ncbi:tail fiber assembly protein, partial [Salmonella enterica]
PEVGVGEICDDDKASLTKWMASIRALKSLALTGISAEATFNKIQWPVLPQ